VVASATDSRPAGDSDRERDKRRRILTAAQQVFAEHGFDAARMEEVARRARVGKGTLYNYYESKEDLLIHAVIASMKEVREGIATAVDPSREQPVRSVEEMLRVAIAAAVRGLTRSSYTLHNQAWGVIARDPEARRRLFEAYQVFYNERERDFEELIEAGARAGQFRSDLDPAQVSLLLQALLDGLLHRATFDGERVEPSRAFGVLLQLLRGGLYRGPAQEAESPR
jgi:AcrR family transcriptional regulator